MPNFLWGLSERMRDQQRNSIFWLIILRLKITSAEHRRTSILFRENLCFLALMRYNCEQLIVKCCKPRSLSQKLFESALRLRSHPPRSFHKESIFVCTLRKMGGHWVKQEILHTCGALNPCIKYLMLIFNKY